MTHTPDPVPIHSEGRGSAFSLVWLVPVAALAVALFAAWRNYADQGPLITVSFGNAAGVAVDETELRFRDISVGLVEDVSFSAALDRVEVAIRLDQEIAPFVDDGARFWVVRPEVTAQGVSGLDTVLSGVYIQGAWDGEIGQPQDSFEGFDAAPLLRAGEEGVTFRLTGEEGLPASETPIFYKGVEVGRVDAAEIMPDGLTVQSDAVILAPYDTLVTASTRFWDISGFSFSIGAQGAGIDFNSLSSLIAGGITFETLGSGGQPISEGAVYELHPDAEAAREDFLLEGEGDAVEMMMIFDDNIAGLRAGAPVELGGLRIGEVVTISGLVDPERFGDSDARLLATMRINPGRIGLQDGAGESELIDFLDTRAADGLRGRLTNASLLTGGLKVELVEVPGAAPAGIDRMAEPYPAIPTAPAAVTNVAASAQGVLSRVESLPIEEVLETAIGLMTDARAVIGSDEVRALPADVQAILSQLESASARVDGLLETLDEAQAAQSLAAAIQNLSDTAEALPPLLDRAGGVLETVEALPLDALLSQANSVLAEAEALLSNDATRAVPRAVTDALAELDTTLGALRALAEAPETRAIPAEAQALLDGLRSVSGRVDALLGRIQEEDTVGTLSAAARDIGTAAGSLPALAEEARALVADARALPLAEIAARADGLLASADTLLSDESTRAVPAEVNTALSELRQTLSSVRALAEDPGTQAIPGQVSALTADLQTAAGRIDALLADAGEADLVGRVIAAVEDVQAAAAGLPELTEQANALLRTARALPLDALTQRASTLIASANAIVAQDSAQQLPEELNGALSSLNQTLDALRDGGVIDNANATLASAREAADALAQASRTLPDLADRLGGVADTASATLGDYGRDSQFTRDLLGAIRQIEEAAEAVDRLARQISRNPASLIQGR